MLFDIERNIEAKNYETIGTLDGFVKLYYSTICDRFLDNSGAENRIKVRKYRKAEKNC